MHILINTILLLNILHKEMRWMELLIIHYTYYEQLVNCPPEEGIPSKSSWTFIWLPAVLLSPDMVTQYACP